MVTGHVRRKLAAELDSREERERRRLLATVEFVDAGKVEFKGVTVSVFDAVFTDGPDKRRLEYRHAQEKLYQSIESGLWKGRVFEDAVLLAELMGAAEGEPIAAQLLVRARGAVRSFNDAFYEEAFAEFGLMVDALAAREGIDYLALEYLRGVRDCYGRILESFAEALDAEAEASMPSLFSSEKDIANYRLLRQHYDSFAKVRDAARLRVRNRKAFWFRAADREAPGLSVRVGEPK